MSAPDTLDAPVSMSERYIIRGGRPGRERLAAREEIDAVVLELYRLAGDASTLMAGPRIVQAWGRRGA
jgi:hypothetical protein